MMTCIFVQNRCNLGKTYAVADTIYKPEVASGLFSTISNDGLLMKWYIPTVADVGRYINDNLFDIQSISKPLTSLTFKAF